MKYNAVFRILTNRKYIGEYKFGDIVIPNAIPAIIDEETFNSVQQRIPVRVCFLIRQKGCGKFRSPSAYAGHAPRRQSSLLQRHIIEKLVCLRYNIICLKERSILVDRRKLCLKR